MMIFSTIFRTNQFAGATTILLQELFYLFLPAAWSWNYSHIIKLSYP